MRIALDIDGVLADFVSGFHEACQMFGYNHDPTGYNLLPQEQFLEVYHWMIESNAFLDLKKCDWTHMARVWHNQGHEIFYITRRRAGGDGSYPLLETRHQWQTKEWLYRNEFPVPHKVIFTQDKGEVCDKLCIPILIEDFLKDARQWNHKFVLCPPACFHLKVILVNRPWNQGDYPHRVNNLGEVNLGD